MLMVDCNYPIQYQIKFSREYLLSAVANANACILVGGMFFGLFCIGCSFPIYVMVFGGIAFCYLVDFMRMPRRIEIHQDCIVIKRNVGRTVLRDIRNVRPFFQEDIKWHSLRFSFSLFKSGFYHTKYGMARLQFCDWDADELAIIAFGDGTQQYVINYPHVLFEMSKSNVEVKL